MCGDRLTRWTDPPAEASRSGERDRWSCSGDLVTTDDIPFGRFSSPGRLPRIFCCRWRTRLDFNNYTTRRGNHEIAVRATFANTRLKNLMVPGIEGGFTKLQPEGAGQGIRGDAGVPEAQDTARDRCWQELRLRLFTRLAAKA